MTGMWTHLGRLTGAVADNARLINPIIYVCGGLTIAATCAAINHTWIIGAVLRPVLAVLS